MGWPRYDDILDELSRLGVPVRTYTVDEDRFHRYVEEGNYRARPYWSDDPANTAIEKRLEHFVSLELTQPRAGEILLDLASCSSPFADIVEQQRGVVCYRQDLSFPRGVSGRRIESDAAHLPLPDAFADVVTAHCSFEHFEENRDTEAIIEAERILKPGGRLCFLPLYTNHRFCTMTDLRAWGQNPPVFDPESIVCITPNWGETHGRLYDTKRFVERIMRSTALRIEVVRIENYLQIDPSCYLKAGLFARKE